MKREILLIFLIAATIAAFFLSVSVGPVSIPLDNVIRVFGGGTPDVDTWETIILTLRLPKAITAVLAGASLAVSGLNMQTIFRNPLADPYVLGISSGATLGVAILVLGTGVVGKTMLLRLDLFAGFGLVAAASLGAALVFALVMLASRNLRHMVALLIIGLMIGYAVGALVSLLIYLSLPEQVQVFNGWLLGSFGGVTWQSIPIFAATVITGLTMSFFCAKPLNALLLGEQYAVSMGVNVRQARWWIISSASLLAGCVTAFCGPIGFLGVAVPHFARSILNTSDHRRLIPAVAIIGALLALIFDLLTQLPGMTIILPLNAVTSLIGAPLIIWVILRRNRFLT